MICYLEELLTALRRPDRGPSMVSAEREDVRSMGVNRIFLLLANSIRQCEIKSVVEYHNKTPTGLRWTYDIKHPSLGNIQIMYETKTRTARA